MNPIWLAALVSVSPPLSASLSRVGEATELAVGEPFYVEVVARHAPGGVALLPDALDLPSALGERTQRRTHERRLEGETEIDIYRLELVPFESGLVEVPPLELALGSTVAATDALLVDVRSTLSKEELAAVSSTRPETLSTLESMAAGDPPPEGLLIPDYRVAVAAIALVGLLLAGVVARSWLKSRGRTTRPVPGPPPRPAHEVAFERLEALQASDYLGKGAFNLYYTELSYTLRAYLGARYGFDALERTVDELLEHVQSLSTPGLDRRRLQTLLFEAEQIKFAKFRPRAETASEAVSTARELVEASRVGASPASPVPPPSPEELSS
ncbi:MAG: hypothetical protein AAFU79_04520 [Myxococcota bacterium]